MQYICDNGSCIDREGALEMIKVCKNNLPKVIKVTRNNMRSISSFKQDYNPIEKDVSPMANDFY